jgi:hypothetical protein
MLYFDLCSLLSIKHNCVLILIDKSPFSVGRSGNENPTLQHFYRLRRVVGAQHDAEPGIAKSQKSAETKLQNEFSDPCDECEALKYSRKPPSSAVFAPVAGAGATRDETSVPPNSPGRRSP